jgi:T5SS/PEP-CTERM-associated repeat protein
LRIRETLLYSGTDFLGDSMARKSNAIYTVSVMATLVAMGAGARAADLSVDNGNTRTVNSLESFTNAMVGENASNQILNIVSGGTLNATNSFIGTNANSASNTANVSTGGSWATTGDLNVGFFGRTSTLNLEGGTATASDIKIGGDAASGSNAVNVSNSGMLSTSGDIILGYAGTYNQLNLGTNGDAVSVNAYLGLEATADVNTASIRGTGSVWSNSNVLNVGVLGSSNKITISEGADMIVLADALIGANLDANYNKIEVTDDGSSLSTATLYVGRNGDHNDLSIYDGADVTSTGVRIGGGTGSTTSADYNTAIVSGQGSTWNISSTLRVGSGTGTSTSDNLLSVSDGAVVAATKTFVGYDSNSDNNIVRVSGTGAMLNAGELVIGRSGASGNLVEVNDNASMVATSISVTAANDLILGHSADIDATSLTFAPGSEFTVSMDSADRGSFDVTGLATLTGTLSLTLDEGSSLSKRYNLINAGSISGTFTSLNRNQIPEGFTPTVRYSGREVYVEFAGNLGSGGTYTRNAEVVRNTINSSFNFGSLFTFDFSSLFSGLADLGIKLNQLAGQNGPTSASFGVAQTSNSFLGAMSNPYRSSQSGNSFAAGNGQYITPVADVTEPKWTTWGAVLGGGGMTEGNADAGSSDVTSYGYGLATGWEKNVSPSEIRGFSIAAGGTDWNIADDMGGGDGIFIQAGINATKFLSAGYVSGSASYGWHNMNANRAIDDETIESDFNMHSLASRLEAGHMLSASLTPYAAFQVQLNHTPAYTEDSQGDDDGFALAYDDTTQASARTELGLKWQNKLNDATTLSGSLAWAHDFTSDESVRAHFVAIDSDSFTITGAKPVNDSGLVSLGATFRQSANTTLAVNLNGQFNEDSQSFGGGLTLAVTW